MDRRRFVVIAGPTASGKTDLAISLANQFPFEIISMDSALVFKGMNIGTAKPSPQILEAFPHHLVDIINPTDHYSAANFVHDAHQLIDEITLRGNIPLFVGGTMLYFKALISPLDDLPNQNPDIRSRLDEEARRYGWAFLHHKLELVDPQLAQTISPNDKQRIQRALEVFEITQTPMSKLLGHQKQPIMDHLLLCIEPLDRSELHNRIAKRFEMMIHSGLIQEVQELQRQWPSLSVNMPSMRCVGYRQTWHYLENQFSLKELVEKGTIATRQLAKRQLTWLRSFSHRITINSLCPKQQLSESITRIKDYLEQ